jgi:hypothetical protein
MNWAQTKENETGYRWHNDFSIDKAKGTPLQSEFVFGTGAGCTAGECIS